MELINKTDVSAHRTKEWPVYFPLLDFVRGLAAVAVVFWHYQHFFFTSSGLNSIKDSRFTQPLYPYFSLFYDYGLYAVHLFWMISGFVFFRVYADSKISAKRFFLARFFRLYPLHFISLIFITILQQIYFSSNGGYFIYSFNDIQHFVLQLALASAWGFEDGDSFNGPIWSVSIEVLIYCVFFLLFTFSRYRNWTEAMILGGIVFIANFIFGHKLLGLAGMYFLLGGLIFFWGNFRFSQRSSTIIAVFTFFVAINFLYLDILKKLSIPLLLFSFVFMIVLADRWIVFQQHSPRRIFEFVGNLSYDIYLVHFPVQIIFILAFPNGVVGDNYYSPISLIAFVSTVLFSSWLSFLLIDKPSREWLRRRYLKT